MHISDENKNTRAPFIRCMWTGLNQVTSHINRHCQSCTLLLASPLPTRPCCLLPPMAGNSPTSPILMVLRPTVRTTLCCCSALTHTPVCYRTFWCTSSANGGVLGTALSNINNEYGMLIVAWDMQRNLAKQWEKLGARYIWQISFDADTQTVTFTGQSSLSVTATLDELIIGPAVVYLPPSEGPILPYTLTYAAPSNAQFPVMRSGPYNFWPVSYADGRSSFCVVVVDRDNEILKLIDCPGSHNIDEVVVDDPNRTIQLIGQDGAIADFDYDTALACFSCCYVFTKDDFLFLAQYFDVPLSDDEATALAEAMPQIDCSLCCRMEGTDTEGSDRVKRSTGFFIAGSFIGAAAGAIGGFLIGGPAGAFFGLTAGYAAGAAIGVPIPDSSDKGQYTLSALEKQFSLVGYAPFLCIALPHRGDRHDIVVAAVDTQRSPAARSTTRASGRTSSTLPSRATPSCRTPGRSRRSARPRPRRRTRPLSGRSVTSRAIRATTRSSSPTASRLPSTSSSSSKRMIP